MTPRTKLLACGAAVAAALTLGAAVGHAAIIGNGPWCAVQNVGAGDVDWNCGFATVQDCRREVTSGMRGQCNMNPYWPPYSFNPPPPPPPRHRHHHG